MTQLIKNDDGSFSYGEFFVLAPVYDRSSKKHIFNILRDGCIPIRHEGNFLTLKSSIKKLTDGIVPSERTEVFSLSELLDIKPDETAPVEAVEAPSEAPEAPEVYVSTDPVIVALKASLASGSDDDYWAFKEVLDQEIGSFC
jgi:hypothetical protein